MLVELAVSIQKCSFYPNIEIKFSFCKSWFAFNAGWNTPILDKIMKLKLKSAFKKAYFCWISACLIAAKIKRHSIKAFLLIKLFLNIKIISSHLFSLCRNKHSVNLILIYNFCFIWLDCFGFSNWLFSY